MPAQFDDHAVRHEDVEGGGGSLPSSNGGAGRVAPDTRGFSCTTTALPSPAGEIVVLRIAGEVDHVTVSIVAAALDDAVERRSGHLVVDLAGMGFCGARGLALLIDSAGRAAARGTGYAVSGASHHVRRVWRLLWPADERPVGYPHTAAAVITAMARQAELRGRRTDPAGNQYVSWPPQLVERASAGDVDCYRELVVHHRRRMYGNALSLLGSTDDADVVDHDVAARLRTTLAGFSAPAGAAPPVPSARPEPGRSADGA